MPRAVARMLLWLSSRFLERLSGVGGFEEAVDPAGDVALEAPFDFAWGSSFGGSARDVGAGLGVEAHARQHDGVQGSVELSVAATVEPVADDLSRRGRDRRGSG